MNPFHKLVFFCHSLRWSPARVRLCGDVTATLLMLRRHLRTVTHEEAMEFAKKHNLAFLEVCMYMMSVCTTNSLVRTGAKWLIESNRVFVGVFCSRTYPPAWRGVLKYSFPSFWAFFSSGNRTLSFCLLCHVESCVCASVHSLTIHCMRCLFSWDNSTYA